MGSVAIATGHDAAEKGLDERWFVPPPKPAARAFDTALWAKRSLFLAALCFAASAGFAIRNLIDSKQPWQPLQVHCPPEQLAAHAAVFTTVAAAPSPGTAVFNQTHADALMKAARLAEEEVANARAEGRKTLKQLQAQLRLSLQKEAAAEAGRNAALEKAAAAEAERTAALQQAAAAEAARDAAVAEAKQHKRNSKHHETVAAQLQTDAAIKEATALIAGGGRPANAQVQGGNVTEQSMDIVGLAVKPTCINKAAIEALQQHLRPRRIYVVTATPRQCVTFRSWGENVACHVQDAFLPGVTKASVAAQLHQLYGVNATSIFRGRDLSGWYLQQFIKLGAAAALPGLSEHFLIWDMDMIPLRSIQLLFPVPEEAASTGGAPLQTLVPVGGVHLSEYSAVYKTLFGQDLEFAPDGSSLVTHMMIVYKPFMQHFLAEVAATNSSQGVTPEAWTQRILQSLPPADLNMEFSEYASYISWVRQRHPGSQRLATNITWSRYGAAANGQAAMDAIAAAAAKAADGLCCPQQSMLQEAAAKGLDYCGWDVGHVKACHYSDPEFSEAYGVLLQ